MLLGLVGQARHGKTTAAEFLVRNHHFDIVSFAEPLKMLCLRGLIHNPPPEMPTDEEYWKVRIYQDRTQFSRWLLQFVGTEIIREVDRDYFARNAVDYGVFKHRAVFPDLRF